MYKIKTQKIEFDAATSNGYVYGEIVRTTTFPVYIELGAEQEYISSAKDDSKTEYRLFTNCTIYMAETEEQLDRENYIGTLKNQTVVIYC